MCKWGNWENVEVLISADDSYTGEPHWKNAPIDACIASIVRALQENAINMKGCCCGHGKYPGWVALEDGRVLVIVDKIYNYPHYPFQWAFDTMIWAIKRRLFSSKLGHLLKSYAH